MTEALWTPSPERIQNSLLRRFLTNAENRWNTSLPEYDAAWSWSVEKPEEFWRQVWDECGVIGEQPDPVLENADNLLEARFFPKAKLNYAENLLRREGDEVAISFWSERGTQKQVTWNELRGLVSRLQQALRDQGVAKGDRVAGFLPNLPETVAAMLATTSLGAVWSSCSPDFGTNGVIDRFGQITPKVLFCADGYEYAGKHFSSLPVSAELGGRLESIQSIVIVPYVQKQPDISQAGEKGLLLDDFIAPYSARDMTWNRVAFSDPLFIMFSSGTTGLPKCIVHSVGGTLLQHLKEHQLQCDIKPDDKLMYFTTCGWMMWNWQVSALASRASIVLFDGSPFHPDGNALADIVATEEVTHFGTSAKYLDACAKNDVRPVKKHAFPLLRTLLSTGSPLAPDGFDYVYRNWKSDICLSSIAGGTDILGCFVGGNPIGPVYRGQCQKRYLGMKVEVFDPDGRPLEGEPGELVCRSPHPSMPTGFWSDPNNTRYRSAYFERFDDVWHQGDWVELTQQGGMIFHGRSDATLNPGGVRIGTAEIYRQVERIEEVVESLVIGQEWDNDVRVVLFVKLQDNADLTDELIMRIREEIRTHASPRHMPAKVIPIQDIPRTKSGKITELIVRDVIHGRPVKNKDSLANPEALELFKGLTELEC